MTIDVNEAGRPLIFVLRRCDRKTFKTLLGDTKLANVIVKLLREIAHNLQTNKNLPLSDKQKRKLSRRKDLLSALAKRSVSIAKQAKLIARNQSALVDTILEPLETTLREVY